MSASTVLGDVTSTLVELLRDEQIPPNSFDVTVTPPGEDITATQRPIINMYLFRVEENDFAKNRDRTAVGAEALHYPPLALNLTYVITPHATEQIPAYRALGEAMRILYDHSIVDGPFLKGGLEHSLEELKLDLCRFNLEELTRIWSAFNQPYRLSVCYQVRIVFIDSVIERRITRAREKENQHV